MLTRLLSRLLMIQGSARALASRRERQSGGVACAISGHQHLAASWCEAAPCGNGQFSVLRRERQSRSVG